jgi:hypothetical protein
MEAKRERRGLELCKGATRGIENNFYVLIHKLHDLCLHVPMSFSSNVISSPCKRKLEGEVVRLGPTWCICS